MGAEHPPPSVAAGGVSRSDLAVDTSGRLAPLPPLDEIREEHVAYVRRVLARLHAPTAWREDLIQETFAEAHRSRDSRLDVRALLFGIARHRVYYWRRRERYQRMLKQNVLARESRDPPPTPEEERRTAERIEAVRAAIAELPEPLRTVFARAHLTGETGPQIAAWLGVPENTVYTRLTAARERFLVVLLRQLARRGLRAEDL